MVFSGILIGLFSAFLQSCSYVFSRRFLLKHASPMLLAFNAQTVMMLPAALMLALLSLRVTVPWSRPLAAWLAGFAVFGVVGNFAFFRAIQEIEASRIASLMGLKLVVLAFLTALFGQGVPSPLQILAIVLAAVSAVGMNFTGGPLPRRGCLYLALNLFCYSVTDIAAGELTGMIHSGSIMLDGMTATAAAFLALGLVSLPVLLMLGFSWRKFADATVYGLCWISAMNLLFVSFGMIGVMYGTIVQSSRGLISILLGVVLLKIGFDKLEPKVGRAAWVRRAVMALLMIAAIALYAMGRA